EGVGALEGLVDNVDAPVAPHGQGPAEPPRRGFGAHRDHGDLTVPSRELQGGFHAVLVAGIEAALHALPPEAEVLAHLRIALRVGDVFDQHDDVHRVSILRVRLGDRTGAGFVLGLRASGIPYPQVGSVYAPGRTASLADD